MSKKIDGIKKINKDEKKEDLNEDDRKKYSRKLVLESIGEGSKKQAKGPLISDIKKVSQKSTSPLSILKKKTVQKDLADNFIDKKVIAENIEIDKLEKLKTESKKKDKIIRNKNRDDVLRKQIDAKLEEEKEKSISFDDLISYEEKSREQQIKNDKIKAIRKKEKLARDRENKKKQDLERMKKQEGKEKSLAEVKEKRKREKIQVEKEKIQKKNLAQKKAEEKKAEREKRRKEFREKIRKNKQNLKNKFNNFFKSISNLINRVFLIFKQRIKKSLILFFLFILIIIVFYLSFFIIVNKFEIDNKISRSFSKIFSFPAFFADGGIVDYYDYIDIKNSFKEEGLSEEEKEYLVQRVIISNLLLDKMQNKYGILVNQNLLKENNFKDKISEYIMRDITINTVALKRIKKIDEMIKSGEDFIKISNKYGDNLGKISLNSKNKKDYNYAEKIMELSVNEISDIIYAENGYYIFKCFQKENDSLNLSYVFIKGINFDEYFNSALNSFKMISLVD